MYKRTPETQARYDKARKDGDTILRHDENDNIYFDLSQAVIHQEYAHWVLIPNSFPYDALFTTHDMLVPRRRFAHIRDATDEERHEYYAIKKDIDNNFKYESIIENFEASRSAPDHFHAHLVVWR